MTGPPEHRPFPDAEPGRSDRGRGAEWRPLAGTASAIGASGVVGSATASLLVERGWTVHGLACRPTDQEGVRPIAADPQGAGATAAALADVRSDAAFVSTWARQESEAENVRVNGATVRNLPDGLARPAVSRHVSLVTGLKLCLGPF